MRRSSIGVALVTLLAGCGAPTVLHVLEAGDPARYSETAPEGWTQPEFADDGWALSDTPLACANGRLHIRQSFMVGADASAWTTLSLGVDGASSFRAWLNGTELALAGPDADAGFALPPGLLRSEDNRLAVAVECPVGATIAPRVIRRAPGAGLAITLGPWLQRPLPDGVTVVFETSQPATARVIVDGRSFDAGGGRHHVATVTGLHPARSYAYHVEVDAGSAPLRSDEASFATPAEVGAPVSFVVWGDHRTDGDKHRRGAAAVLAEAPDFVIDTGDLVDQSDEEEWRVFFAAEYSLLRRVAIFPVIGNHEAGSGGAPRFAELFPVAGGGTRYGFDYGVVHVAMLDSNSDLEAQAKWLDGDLASARAAGATALFIGIHHGLASSGNSANHGSNDEVQRWVAPVASAHGVIAVFAGHDHFYERGRRADLWYVVSGGGGAPASSAGEPLATTQVLTSSPHHVIVRVLGRSVFLRAQTPDGTVLDDVQLR